MADVFQFEIDETHPENNFDPDDNDEIILDGNDVSQSRFFFRVCPSQGNLIDKNHSTGSTQC
jgi:hypothetical protein